MEIANSPKPPYYAVVFTSLKSDSDDGYNKMSERMLELVKKQPGFLGFESARNELVSSKGMSSRNKTSFGGITISYWKDLESINNWKNNSEHILAQKYGKDIWYNSYKVRICKVERDYIFEQKHNS